MKRFLVYIVIIGLTGLGLWYAQTFYSTQYPPIGIGQQATSLLENIQNDDFFPEPFKKTGSSGAGLNTALNGHVVAVLTNAERASNGKKPLKENTQLALAAHRKILDMINLQYFEHTSPTGKGPADIIEGAGYTYVVVGENLAEGDFVDNADLVQGWMNSPGHRANILNEKFTEIGVATERGTLNGKRVWFAVQEFGRPLSDCPGINQSLKTQIATNETQVQIMQQQLQQVQADMNHAKQAGDSAAYNNLVPKYNAIANEINALVAATKQIVETYNGQVKSFNNCVE